MVSGLIITADDFGLGPGVNRAVADAHRAGVLTAASLMVVGPAFHEATELAKSMPQLDIGLHFVLAGARPVSPASKVSSLVDGDGVFLPRHRLVVRAVAGQLRREHVTRELQAQWERLVGEGVVPTYVNGDQHVHLLPGVRDVVLGMAGELGLAVRVPCEERVWVIRGAPLSAWTRVVPRLGVKGLLRVLARALARRCRLLGIPTNDHFLSPFGIFPSPRFTIQTFQTLLGRLLPGLTELMVHPSYPDDATRRFWGGGEARARGRQQELDSLLDPRFAALLKELKVPTTTYARLPRTRSKEADSR